MSRSRASRAKMGKAIIEWYKRMNFNANIEDHAKGCSYGEPDYENYEIKTLCICGLLTENHGKRPAKAS